MRAVVPAAWDSSLTYTTGMQASASVSETSRFLTRGTVLLSAVYYCLFIKDLLPFHGSVFETTQPTTVTERL